MSKLTIIGGGIGGLATANAFQHFNIDFQLYEAAPQLTDVGAGIGISESTIRLLDQLGLKNDLLESGTFVENAIIVDKLGKPIRKLPIKNGGICIHRKKLIEVLKKHISKDCILLDHRLTTFSKKDGNIELRFQNGRSARTGTLIACDGINSTIRKSIFPNIEKRYSGQTIWRGIAHVALQDFFKKSYIEFWGENLRFATIPIGHLSYYWYAVKEAQEKQKDNRTTLNSDLQNLFKHFKPEIAHVISATKEILRNDMYDLTPHQEPWHEDNIVFVGDAIHATTPNLAQGGCQAIEDAFTLAKIIHKKGISQSSFGLYKRIRQDKVFSIVNQSWRYGKMSHPKNKVSEWTTKTLFKVLPASYFESRYKQLTDLTYLNNID